MSRTNTDSGSSTAHAQQRYFPVDGSRTRRRADRRRRALGRSAPPATCEAESPGKTYAILEARDAIGGTWDLFRYPGIRSDSDMFTLGYDFRPWEEAEGDRGRPVDPQLHPRDRARPRRRAPHPLPPPGRARRLVERGRALDRGGRAHRHAARPCGSPARSSSAAPATTATTRATARTSRARERFRGRSSTRSTGRRTSTTTASAWS